MASRLVAMALTCAVALLTAASASAEPLSPTDPLYSPSAPLVDENPYVSAEYSGTLTQHSSLTSVVEDRTVTAELSWNTKVSGPVDQIEYTAIYGASAIHWQASELTGYVTIGGEYPSSKTKFGCMASLSPSSSDGGTGGIELPLDEPGYPAGGGNPETNTDYRVAPPQGIPFSLLTSSTGASGECGSAIWGNSESWFGQALSQPGWEGGAGPVVYFPPGAPFTHEISPPTYECSCGVGATSKVTLKSSLKFTSPVLPGGSAPTTGPTTGHAPSTKPPGPPISCGTGSKRSCMEKKAAQDDIRTELKPVTFNCELASLGIAGIVAALASPETSAAVFIAAEGVVGGEVAALAGTTCGVLLARIYKDAKDVEDPPTGGLGKLAAPAFPRGPAVHLPPCGRYKQKALQFCKSLRDQTLAYANSLADGEAIAAALLTTVDRMTGAELSHNSSALGKQGRHATSLRKQLAAQGAAQRRAGRAIARLLYGAHFKASISAAQAQAGQAAVLSKLAARGLAASALVSAAASELPTGPIAAEAGFAG
jgi:hypothetical protein